jgi:hypothetical protein
MFTQSASAEVLAFRESDGLSVSLLWERETDHIRVVVRDRKCGHSFELGVAKGDNPMDVFRHPYAYAPHPVTEAPPSASSI